MDPARVARILIQACCSLNEAHEAGLLHRDISPQNVLISYEGEVKLTDFGIARALAVNETFHLPGNLHGKFGYMPPEQLETQPLDQRADIFSCGVVMHEMLTGQRLFRGKDPRETIEMILTKEVQPPSHFNPSVTPEIDQVVMSALRKNREERYQSAADRLSHCDPQGPPTTRGPSIVL